MSSAKIKKLVIDNDASDQSKSNQDIFLEIDAESGFLFFTQTTGKWECLQISKDVCLLPNSLSRLNAVRECKYIGCEKIFTDLEPIIESWKVIQKKILIVKEKVGIWFNYASGNLKIPRVNHVDLSQPQKENILENAKKKSFYY